MSISAKLSAAVSLDQGDSVSVDQCDVLLILHVHIKVSVLEIEHRRLGGFLKSPSPRALQHSLVSRCVLLLFMLQCLTICFGFCINDLSMNVHAFVA